MNDKKDRLFQVLIYSVTGVSCLVICFLVFYIIKESMPFFFKTADKAFRLSGRWNPLGVQPDFSLMPMLFSTLYVSLLSVGIALPLGVGCSIFLTFCIPKGSARLLLSFIDLLAGIPSVIFGFIGLVLLVKFLETYAHMSSGECVLAASILLAVMLLPYIVSNCTESAIRAREHYEITSLSLGISKDYMVRRLILPELRGSILVSVILSIGRAMGETMAVMMVIGNSPIFPHLLGRAETIPALIALEMGTVEYGSLHYGALYGAALILILLLFALNVTAYYFHNKRKGGNSD